MEHYFEIKILPDAEFSPSFLMNALYSKLHRALVHLQCTDIGLSFPKYGKNKLGDTLRFHSHQNRLEDLMNTGWLKGMHDHIRLGTITPIPIHVPLKYAVFCRLQANSNIERIRRRQMRRHSLSYKQVVERYPVSLEQRLDLPFIALKSASTEQSFKLFIKQEKMPEPLQGKFNTYGLSKEATVPIF